MELRDEEIESENIVSRDGRKDIRKIGKAESNCSSAQPHDII